MSSAVVFGATGLIGSELLVELCGRGDVTSVAAYGRRPPKLEHSKLTFVSGRFESLHEDLQGWTPKVVFIALGTTIKKAGSQAAFRDVDFRMVVDAAAWAKAVGAPTLVLVSSVGASASSPFFYPRVKGEAEHALAQLGFSRLFVVRPGLLLGKRDEVRFGEIAAAPMMKLVAPILMGSFQKYRPIAGRDVAKAMVQSAFDSSAKMGAHILEGAPLFYS